MTDEEVEAFIWDEINARAIILGDMTGMPHCGVDPSPEDRITPLCEKEIRSNRFKSYMGSDRMIELLCVGGYNETDGYPSLKISFHDLFRFWWNRCAEKENIVEDVLEDIFEYFKEKMRPPEEERPGMDLTVNFGEVSICHEGQERLLTTKNLADLNEESPEGRDEDIREVETATVSIKGYEAEVDFVFHKAEGATQDHPGSPVNYEIVGGHWTEFGKPLSERVLAKHELEILGQLESMRNEWREDYES